MKWALLSSLATAAVAFAPLQQRSSSTTALPQSAVPADLVREAPAAGWEPDWEDRPGLTQEEFLESDMSKPDLAGMWECPLTRWDSEG
jgi:hypothetical protein